MNNISQVWAGEVLAGRTPSKVMGVLIRYSASTESTQRVFKRKDIPSVCLEHNAMAEIGLAGRVLLCSCM